MQFVPNDSGLAKLNSYVDLISQLEGKPRDSSFISDGQGFCNGISALYAFCIERSFRKPESEGETNQVDITWFKRVAKMLSQWDGEDLANLITIEDRHVQHDQKYRDIELFLSQIHLFQSPEDASLPHGVFDWADIDAVVGGLDADVPSSQATILPTHNLTIAFTSKKELAAMLDKLVLPGQFVRLSNMEHAMSVVRLDDYEGKPQFHFFDPNNPIAFDDIDTSDWSTIYTGKNAEDTAADIIASYNTSIDPEKYTQDGSKPGYALNIGAYRHINAKPVDYSAIPENDNPRNAEKLLQKYCRSFGTIDYKTINPLHLAINSANSVEVVRAWLAAGVNIHLADMNGRTPIHSAAISGYADIGDALYQAGADLTGVDTTYGTLLHAAASNGHLEIVEKLLKTNAIDINHKDSTSQSALALVAIFGYKDVVEALIKAGADINCVDNDGKTLLHHAAANGHLELVKSLLKRKVIDVKQADNSSQTALHAAVLYGQHDVTDELLKSIPCNYVDNEYRTLLHAAVASGNLEMVKKVIRVLGRDWIEKADDSGQTALHTAATYGYTDMVDTLNRTVINVTDALGNTPLHLAASNGHLNFVQKLIAKGTVALEQKDVLGQSALHHAANIGYVDILKDLIAAGADFDSEDSDRQTPLYLAALNGHTDIVQELIRSGADIDQANSLRETPLYAAAVNGHTEIVRELLKNGADAAIQTIEDETALSAAIKADHFYCTSVLMGIDPNPDKRKSIKEQIKDYMKSSGFKFKKK